MTIVNAVLAMFVGFCIGYTIHDMFVGLVKKIKESIAKKKKKTQPESVADMTTTTINFSELVVGTIEHRERFIANCGDDKLKLLHKNFPRNPVTVERVSEAIVKSLFGTETEGNPLGEKWKTLCLWTSVGLGRFDKIDDQFFNNVKFNPGNYGFGFPEGSESVTSVDQLTLDELTKVSEFRHDYSIKLNIGDNSLFFRRGNNLFLIYRHWYYITDYRNCSSDFSDYTTESLIQFQLT